MAPRTWKIEVTCDFMSQTQNKTADEIVRTQAKIILTQMMLLADRRQPQIVVETEDAFTSSSEIMLVDVEEDNSPAGEAKAAEGAKTQNAAWARSAGYTVADKGTGWKFNDPDGKWSDESFKTEAEAWEAAYVITQRGNNG